MSYSSRNATTGSRRAARRAGKYPAMNATTSNSPLAPANVSGSPGVNPYNILRTSRAHANEAPSPIGKPISTSTASSRSMSCNTPARVEPNASRMAISERRREAA